MRIVGVLWNSEISVARLSEDASRVGVLCGLDEFWADAESVIASAGVGTELPTAEVEQVVPILPSAGVFCVGLNYRAHVAEGAFRDQPLPATPTIFGRWARTLTVSGTAVPVPAAEPGLDWEGEVAAWIGRTLVDVTADEALAGVIGYSVFNDLTARSAQHQTTQWTLGKNTDLSGPIGPIVPASEVGDLRSGLLLQTRVNGEVVQSAPTSDMLFSVGETLAHISRTTTLRPGDVLATGTPSGVGYSRSPRCLLVPGDVVEVGIDKLGTIQTPVIGDDGRRA